MEDSRPEDHGGAGSEVKAPGNDSKWRAGDSSTPAFIAAVLKETYPHPSRGFESERAYLVKEKAIDIYALLKDRTLSDAEAVDFVTSLIRSKASPVEMEFALQEANKAGLLGKHSQEKRDARLNALFDRSQKKAEEDSLRRQHEARHKIIETAAEKSSRIRIENALSQKYPKGVTGEAAERRVLVGEKAKELLQRATRLKDTKLDVAEFISSLISRGYTLPEMEAAFHTKFGSPPRD